ncbi:MAG: polyphosphate:AMP phosphotransferase [Tepidisphaeraceae bacterium]
MFESAEVGNSIDKEVFKSEVPRLREALLAAQTRLAGSDMRAVVLISGSEGAGKTAVLNRLLAWLDARGVRTHAVRKATDEETNRPFAWRFWRELPPAGHMGMFLGSWYTKPLTKTVLKGRSIQRFDQDLTRIIDFERMLSAEGTIVIKLWLHLSRAAQKKRFKEIESDPAQSWRVTRRDWKLLGLYDQAMDVVEHLVRRTSTGEAPWHIIEGGDPHYRDLTVGRIVQKTLDDRLNQRAAEPPRPAPAPVRIEPPGVNIIGQLDQTQALGEKDYEKKLAKLQGELAELARELYNQKQSMVLVFEGSDAAGKGGAIRRLTEAMDARDYAHISVAAPTDEERAHPYLWRFWRQIPYRGRVTLFDRSWYGRVLVERVEGFATPPEWQRAYSEINQFEEQLTDFGIIVLKFWLAITPEEQLERFKSRQKTPYKQYKITDDDWRNRDRWDSYIAAACEMIEKTNTQSAPWILVESNNKEWARIKVVSTVVSHLKNLLN